MTGDPVAKLMTELAKSTTLRGVHRGWPPAFTVLPVASVRQSGGPRLDKGNNSVGYYEYHLTVDVWCKDRQATVKMAIDTALATLHAIVLNQYELPEAGGVTHIVTESTLYGSR